MIVLWPKLTFSPELTLGMSRVNSGHGDPDVSTWVVEINQSHNAFRVNKNKKIFRRRGFFANSKIDVNSNNIHNKKRKTRSIDHI